MSETGGHQGHGGGPDRAGPVDRRWREPEPPPVAPPLVWREVPAAPQVCDSDPASESSVRSLSRRLADYTQHIENLNIAEYVELLRNPRRMFVLNFISGIGRGFGIAIGFTLLGAVAILVLQRLVLLNLPGIGDFITEIVRIVQGNLQGGLRGP